MEYKLLNSCSCSLTQKPRDVHFTVQIDNYQTQLVFNLEELQLKQGCVLSMNKCSVGQNCGHVCEHGNLAKSSRPRLVSKV